MSNDTSIDSLFVYASGPSQGSGDASPRQTVVATFVEHFANLQPPRGEAADLVAYASGPLQLSSDGNTLSGELRMWRNIMTPEFTFLDANRPADAFADARSQSSVIISVARTGTATYRKMLKGKPIGGFPAIALKANYQSGLLVELSAGLVRSLSFTLA